MEKTELVFLCGLSQSGKDTVGEEFVKQGYTRVAFADAVKVDYAIAQGLDIELLYIQGPIKESHREGIIAYAESMRAIDPMYWIKKAVEPYLDENNNIKEGLKLVFTDVRRRSEIDWIYSIKNIQSCVEDNGDVIGHYERAKLFLIKRPIVDTDVLSHETIGYMEGISRQSDFQFIDAIILNNGTKEDLAKKVERLLEAYAI